MLAQSLPEKSSATNISTNQCKMPHPGILQELKISQTFVARMKMWTKLILSIILPLSAVAALCTVAISRCLSEVQQAELTLSSLSKGKQIASAVHALHQEASMVCRMTTMAASSAVLYLNFPAASVTVYVKLVARQNISLLVHHNDLLSVKIWSKENSSASSRKPEELFQVKIPMGNFRGNDPMARWNQKATEVQNETDKALRNLTVWPKTGMEVPELPQLCYTNQTGMDGWEMSDIGTFNVVLTKFRQGTYSSLADKTRSSCHSDLDWYIDKADEMQQYVTDAFRQNKASEIWSAVFAYELLLRTQNFLGHMTAFGLTYTASNGNYSSAEIVEFSELYGVIKQNMISVISRFDEIFGDDILSEYVEHSVAADYFAKVIENGNFEGYSKPVWNLSSFRTTMDQYDTLTHIMEHRVLDYIEELLNNVKTKANRDFIGALAPVIVVICLCPTALIWYAISSQRMLWRAGNYMAQLAETSAKLSEERQRTEFLLSQMLPASVVACLKENRPVKPENFVCVTAMFIDIDGFTGICARSTPLEVISMLNGLYSTFDHMLDRYDTYKLETIGDCYVCVSGAPKRNGVAHASEICTLALDIMATMDSYYVPHFTSEKLPIRIGIHSGPCITGLIGLRMPHYCLYGDAIAGAARMESTGEPDKIHISTTTADLLRATCHGLFKMSARSEGRMQVDLDSYWLLAKVDFWFEVSNEFTFTENKKSSSLERTSEVASRQSAAASSACLNRASGSVQGRNSRSTHAEVHDQHLPIPGSFQEYLEQLSSSRPQSNVV